MPEPSIEGVGWSPDHKRLAVGSLNGTLAIYDATTLQLRTDAGAVEPQAVRAWLDLRNAEWRQSQILAIKAHRGARAERDDLEAAIRRVGWGDYLASCRRLGSALRRRRKRDENANDQKERERRRGSAG